jgi:uncharacterized protein YjbI with pentapeptide repeats
MAGDKNPFVQDLMTAEQVLKAYGQGRREFRRIEIAEESSLRNANLSGVDFTNSFLSLIDFRDARLQNVCFDSCNVKISDFSGADLTGASFRGTAICSACFKNATLDRMIVEDADWYGCKINGVEQLLELKGNS